MATLKIDASGNRIFQNEREEITTLPNIGKGHVNLITARIIERTFNVPGNAGILLMRKRNWL